MLLRHQSIVPIITFILLTFFKGYAEKEDVVTNTADVKVMITALSMADLSIDNERVEKSTVWISNILTPADLEQRKSNLIVELCRQIGADVLVDPQFTFKKRILGGGKLTVSGYPARYKNFRPMTDAEIDSLIISPKFNSDRVIFINQ